ncbi:hypothetical protein L6164_005425 [Bauhinia variegata]|uniref:Uncharacterized protein n=1 Tax=Bauhinia variegata TaxID=167791 RepID=A0ACB9PRA8_BAUVA|nr:hypothetical protein L6164_005425 [Bauhinia variegata]
MNLKQYINKLDPFTLGFRRGGNDSSQCLDQKLSSRWIQQFPWQRRKGKFFHLSSKGNPTTPLDNLKVEERDIDMKATKPSNPSNCSQRHPLKKSMS